MEPTLDIGQRVLVNRVIYHFGDPEIGDIVVFHPPRGSVNGDSSAAPETQSGEACPAADPTRSRTRTSSSGSWPARATRCRSRTATRSSTAGGQGATSSGPCRGGGSCNLPKTITIPPDDYFMMGDNRGSSDDSRFWGPVPRDWIIGEAFFTYWPPDRIGFL